MAAAIGLITLGIIFVYSALKGLSITEVMAGVTGTTLDPKGKKGTFTGSNIPGPTGDNTTNSSGGNALIKELEKVGQTKYNLKTSQICRPQNANYGSPTSLHKECLAIDMVGATEDKIAFARWAKEQPGVVEVYCDQAGMVAPGYNHLDHVHVGVSPSSGPQGLPG